MKRRVLNVQTGEATEVDLSPEELLQVEADRAATESSPERLKFASNLAAANEVKSDAKFQNLISKTPAQVKTWVENSFPSLTLPEQRDLATIVMAIGILGRRL